MQIHFLGTNGWYSSGTGDTLCVLIDAAEAYIILDAGNGLRKIDRVITDPSKPIYLFLSHFHLDHVSGFHILPKFAFPQGMTVICQPGGEAYLHQLIAPPWTGRLTQLRWPVSVQEVGEGDHPQAAPFPFRCRFLRHADPCFGYRFELEGKSVAFCTDTGVCNAVVELARGADLLISECAWKKAGESLSWPHLSPGEAAEMAREAGVQKLALVHFDAFRYAALADRKEAEGIARRVFPETVAMNDDRVLPL